MVAPFPVVDIGINITSNQLKKNWESMIQRAVDSNVCSIILTGTSLKYSLQSLAMARSWNERTGNRILVGTVGIHPHNAKEFQSESLEKMRQLLLENDFAVAVGECGLDFNRMFSSKEQQLEAFRGQVRLACELQKPLFVHERDAHFDLLRVLEEFPSLPPLVVHCFTGTYAEAQAYLDRGFFLGFTGTICKHQRGAHLRELLSSVPLNRIMIETDAPWMGFVKGRRISEPSDVNLVAEAVAIAKGLSIEEVRRETTLSANQFFRLSLSLP